MDMTLQRSQTSSQPQFEIFTQIPTLLVAVYVNIQSIESWEPLNIQTCLSGIAIEIFTPDRTAFKTDKIGFVELHFELPLIQRISLQTNIQSYYSPEKN